MRIGLLAAALGLALVAGCTREGALRVAGHGAPLLADYLAAKGHLSDEARQLSHIGVAAVADLIARGGAPRSAAWWAGLDQRLRDALLDDALARIEAEGRLP